MLKTRSTGEVFLFYTENLCYTDSEGNTWGMLGIKGNKGGCKQDGRQGFSARGQLFCG